MAKNEVYERFRYKNICQYEGITINGQPCGKGKAIFDNGNIAEGIFSGDVMDSTREFYMIRGNHTIGVIYTRFHLLGLGSLEFKQEIDGVQYEGTEKGYFKDGLLHGVGTKVIYNGVQRRVLKGNFEEGNLSGQGELLDENGDIYQGQFQYNLLNGPGKHYTREGVFEGSFKNNIMYKGKYVMKTGEIFEGQFINKRLTGRGKFTSAKGERMYEGEFQNGYMISGSVQYFYCLQIQNGIEKHDSDLNGEGQIIFNSGKVYSGTFVNNFLTSGTINNKDGETWSGSFQFNLLSGQGRHETPAKELAFRNGRMEQIKTVHVGEFKHGFLNGKGQIFHESGCVSDGDFIEGKLASGMKRFQSGEVQEGQFTDGVLSGKGMVTFPNGTLQKGIYERGAFIEGTRQRPTCSFELIHLKKGRKSLLDDFLLHLFCVNEQCKYIYGMPVMICAVSIYDQREKFGQMLSGSDESLSLLMKKKQRESKEREENLKKKGKKQENSEEKEEEKKLSQCEECIEKVEKYQQMYPGIYSIAITSDDGYEAKKWFKSQRKFEANIGIDYSDQLRHYQDETKLNSIPYFFLFKGNGELYADGMNLDDPMSKILAENEVDTVVEQHSNEGVSEIE